ncbi:MAG: hypothetical protein WC477_02485 [Patescibacteria group bacterium]
MKEFAISNITTGQLNAVVKNIMRQTGTDDPNESVRLINSGKWSVARFGRNWYERDGVIYFTVTSDGTTGPEWITRLESKGFRLIDSAISILNSPDFKPTNNVMTQIAVLKGTLFAENDRITKNIRSVASKRGWITPNAEIACLIREYFTDEDIEEMGFVWIIAMHEPINNSQESPYLLSVSQDDDGRSLTAASDSPARCWYYRDGLAFVVPQVSS